LTCEATEQHFIDRTLDGAAYLVKDLFDQRTHVEPQKPRNQIDGERKYSIVKELFVASAISAYGPQYALRATLSAKPIRVAGTAIRFANTPRLQGC